MHTSSTKITKKSPVLGLLLNFFIPGFGSFYAGSWLKGCIYMVLGVVVFKIMWGMTRLMPYFNIYQLIYLVICGAIAYSAFQEIIQYNIRIDMQERFERERDVKRVLSGQAGGLEDVKNETEKSNHRGNP
jgi:peptidoglycan biosynthesis protein MviN/MurJ (putative lipid II flippase)